MTAEASNCVDDPLQLNYPVSRVNESDWSTGQVTKILVAQRTISGDFCSSDPLTHLTR